VQGTNLKGMTHLHDLQLSLDLIIVRVLLHLDLQVLDLTSLYGREGIPLLHDLSIPEMPAPFPLRPPSSSPSAQPPPSPP